MDSTFIFRRSDSIVGGLFMIAGCTIGAGMLGLPVVSALAGFIPSTLAMLLVCLFMTTTGLLLLEAILWFDHEVNLTSLAGFALGRFGKIITGVLFMAVFYCLLVAYASGGGELMAGLLSGIFGTVVSNQTGSIVTIALVGTIIYMGTRFVDQLNRVFMIGHVIPYAGLVLFGLPHVTIERLASYNPLAAFSTIPILIVSFGYHNLIPSLTYYMRRNVSKIRFSIIAGNILSFTVYAIWQGVILGILPNQTQESFRELVSQSDMVTGLLKNVTGSPLVIIFINAFAIFTIASSFMTNALSCIDFMADGLSIKQTPVKRALLCVLTLVPPLVLSLSYPHLFLNALGFAGGFATVILFGILPVLIVWNGRYKQNMTGLRLVPGGKSVLVLVLVISAIFLGIELFKKAGGM